MGDFEVARHAADSRLRRAEELIGQLQESLAKWREDPPVSVHIDISPDRHSWNARLTVRDLPDKQRLGGVFGEAVHQIRAALDNAMWAVVRAFDAAPDTSKDIHFPVFLTRESWDKAAGRWLGALPPLVTEALLFVQPFSVPSTLLAEPRHHPLSAVSRYDNMDKHVAFAHVDHQLSSFAATIDVTFVAGISAKDVMVIASTTSDDLVDGAVIASQTLSAEIESVGGGTEVPFEIVVFDQAGDYVGLIGGPEGMVAVTRVVLQRLFAAAELERTKASGRP